eukprot:COSAG05_NODE_2871_length_2554_cov_14.393140_1_plen_43_part_10
MPRWQCTGARKCCCGTSTDELSEGGKIEPKVYFANERTFLSWL